MQKYLGISGAEALHAPLVLHHQATSLWYEEKQIRFHYVGEPLPLKV